MPTTVTYYLNTQEIATVSLVDNQLKATLTPPYDMFIFAIANDLGINPDKENHFDLNTISDLKKLLFGKDTFIVHRNGT